MGIRSAERIERLAAFIVEHWEKRRASMEGKAMVVTMSRDIAARLYEAIRTLRPGWHDPDDEGGIAQRRKLHEPGAVRERAGCLERCLQRESRLAAAPGSGQHDQTRVAPGEHLVVVAGDAARREIPGVELVARDLRQVKGQGGHLDAARQRQLLLQERDLRGEIVGLPLPSCGA